MPNDGQYTIANSTSGMLSSWWTTADHTGNTNGYMMIVNASLSKTDYFYKKTVTGLCPGTVYEFSAWVLNLFNNGNSVYPNLTFSIIDPSSGKTLATYNTGDIKGSTTAVEWQQCGIYFTSTTDSVIVKITNNKAGAAPGNDLALDDITFRPCGATATVTVNGSTSTTIEVCENSSVAYTLTGSLSSSDSSTSYQWQDTWIINGLELYPGSKITVSDRYGKTVLDTATGENFSWDGKYLGRSLPTANYWYVIQLTDGRVFQGWLLIKNRNDGKII